MYEQSRKRIFYKANNFATDKTVTAYLWDPNLNKSSLQTFTELEEGLYYLDYTFDKEGSYVGKFYEDDIPTVSGVFDIVMDLQRLLIVYK